MWTTGSQDIYQADEIDLEYTEKKICLKYAADQEVVCAFNHKNLLVVATNVSYISCCVSQTERVRGNQQPYLEMCPATFKILFLI